MQKNKTLWETIRSGIAPMVMLSSLVMAYFIFYYILGDPSNFENGNNLNEPLKNNYLGVIYKGGPVVILLLTFQIILLTYIFERFFSITAAAGKTINPVFGNKIKTLVQQQKYVAALEACDEQRGALANVLQNGINTFLRVKADTELGKEQKILAIERDFEEATQLELPVLHRNMIIISTLASISTLVGLLGTVTGMIKAFSALARVGAPDAIGLAGGISQALVTTALGISTAAIAIVFFNYFNNRIEKIILAIDETAFSVKNSLKIQLGNSVKQAEPIAS